MIRSGQRCRRVHCNNTMMKPVGAFHSCSRAFVPVDDNRSITLARRSTWLTAKRCLANDEHFTRRRRT